MPRLLFCGTVVPAIAASNPHMQFRQIELRNQWGIRFKIFGTEVLVPGTSETLRTTGFSQIYCLQANAQGRKLPFFSS